MVKVVNPAGTPVPDADVELPSLGLRARTRGSGTVTFEGLPAVATMITVRRLGFLPDSEAIELDAGRRATITLHLESAIPTVDTMIARARAIEGKMADFEHRRATGHGTYITRRQIEERNPAAMRDMMHGIPEVVVLNPGIKFARTAESDCLPEYYVDGALVRNISIDDFTPSEIEGIELYRGPSEVPARYLSRGTSCGLVMIWTRSPSRTGASPLQRGTAQPLPQQSRKRP